MDTLEKLEKFRKRHKLTDEQCGKVFGFASSTLRRWRGGDKVNKQVAEHLDTLLGLSHYAQRMQIEAKMKEN